MLPAVGDNTQESITPISWQCKL